MMKINLFFGLTFLVTSVIYGQDSITDNIKQLYKQKEYDKVIKYKLKDNDLFSSKALYYKGMSYYMKSEDKDALKYFNLAIEKGPVEADMYYYKGMIYFYAKMYNESLNCFDKAIAIFSSEPDYYASKGEAYSYLNNKDSALFYYERATKFPNCRPRFFILLGAIYSEQQKNENALSVSKKALSLMSPNDDSYQLCFFNIGLLQQLTGNELEAKETFEKYISIYPEDYQAMAKLIQAYYSLSEYDKAVQYKEKLYTAYKAKKLNENMSEMFCFNQFKWKDKLIMAYELFKDIDNGFKTIKYQFFVMNNNGQVDYIVQSESSPAVTMTEGKYILALEKDNNHYSYWSYKFNDDFNYKLLKEQITKILNGDIKPDSSTIRPK